MTKQNTHWNMGRGKLGILHPLLGSWSAESESAMGRVKCTRKFRKTLDNKYIELSAKWEFGKSTYEELAIFGVENGKICFWSFTSDGKRSEGNLSDGSDIHAEAICFEAEMPGGTARMVYWPREGGGFRWAVESKSKKGWKRFAHHEYYPLNPL